MASRRRVSSRTPALSGPRLMRSPHSARLVTAAIEGRLGVNHAAPQQPCITDEQHLWRFGVVADRPARLKSSRPIPPVPTGSHCTWRTTPSLLKRQLVRPTDDPSRQNQPVSCWVAGACNHLQANRTAEFGSILRSDALSVWREGSRARPRSASRSACHTTLSAPYLTCPAGACHAVSPVRAGQPGPCEFCLDCGARPRSPQWTDLSPEPCAECRVPSGFWPSFGLSDL
jgi:hypothetical protein